VAINARVLARRVVFSACALLATASASAQVRGVYPTGMSAVNSGSVAAPGWSYSNLFIVNSRDERAGPDGETLATGEQSVLLDLNTFSWGSREPVFAGARFAAAATIILSRNSLESDVEGSLGGGSGLGDLFIQPLMLGWTKGQYDWRAAYGIVAPTGRFEAGADDNVGSGYWTHALSSGLTYRLPDGRGSSVSAFFMYELHGRQETTDVRPGDTLTLDASWMYSLPGPAGRRAQLGVVGYAQWQLSDKRGPDVTPEQANERYRVYALGLAGSMGLGERSGLAFKFFRELDARSTFEGYSAQLSASVAF
jgi:hypothetical protein